jgi:hypothetical protein
VLAAMLLAPMARRAEAVPLIVSRGTSVVAFEALPDVLSSALPSHQGGRWRLGYRYSYVGVFGAPVWTWKGGYCLTDGSKYVDLSDAQAQAIARWSPGGRLPRTPFFYRFPAAWVLLTVVLALGAPVALIRRMMLSRTPPPTSVLGS